VYSADNQKIGSVQRIKIITGNAARAFDQHFRGED
jgi:hypothetical protein